VIEVPLLFLVSILGKGLQFLEITKNWIEGRGASGQWAWRRGCHRSVLLVMVDSDVAGETNRKVASVIISLSFLKQEPL